MEGKVVTYKAKLGEKGYQQSQCVDYDETSNIDSEICRLVE